MGLEQAIAAVTTSDDPYTWIGQVLTNFAIAEQALGELSLALGLSVEKGSLCNLQAVRHKLQRTDCRKCRALDSRIDRWSLNRPFRHLLAHATVTVLTDEQGAQVIVTRHLPRDREDVTPDRMWTESDRLEILRQANADGRSIRDHVKGIIGNAPLITKLRSAAV